MVLILGIFAVVPSVLAIDDAIPTYDPKDTWIDFYIHYKLEEPISSYPYVHIWKGSGTRVGNIIITAGHVVCSNLDHKKVWLSFPNRFSFLKHHELDLDFSDQIQKEFKIVQSQQKHKRFYDQALYTINERSTPYDIYLPKQYECNLKNRSKSRFDLAILTPSQKNPVDYFSDPSHIQKIDCTKPTKNKLSFSIAGGNRKVIESQSKFWHSDQQTALGVFELMNPSYRGENILFGHINLGYQSAQLRSNPKKSHTLFMGSFNKGDSGAGFFQTNCQTKNHFECLFHTFTNKLISTQKPSTQMDAFEPAFQKFLQKNQYYYVINSESDFSQYPFWGIGTGIDHRVHIYGPTFYENRKFLAEHLPKEMLSENCFAD